MFLQNTSSMQCFLYYTVHQKSTNNGARKIIIKNKSVIPFEIPSSGLDASKQTWMLAFFTSVSYPSPQVPSSTPEHSAREEGGAGSKSANFLAQYSINTVDFARRSRYKRYSVSS